MAGGALVSTGPVKNYPGKVTFHVILTSILAASGGLLFGYDNGIAGGVTAMDSFLRKFYPEVVARKSTGGNYCKYDNQKLQAFTSTLYIAGLVATFAAAPTSRKYGRLTTMRVAAFAFCVGTVLCAAAQNLTMVLLGRIVLGIGVGFANQAVPLFLSETAPTKIRGSLNILFQLAVTIGILAANLVNYGANKIDKWGWRLALGGAGVPAILLAIGSLFLTDTPNSLIDRGKYEEGKRILKKVRGVDDVDEEFDDIVTASKLAAEVKHPFRNILKRRNRPSLVIAMLFQMFQQMTGINAVIFYAPILFQSVGFGSSASLYSAVIIGAVNVLSTFVAVFVVDRIGRRKLLLEAGGQMFISQLAIGLISAIQLKNTGPGLPKASGIAVIVLTCVFISSFAWSWGPLGWLVPSETFPLETRSAGQSITVSTNLFFTFLIAQVFLSMLCKMQYGVYLFFTAWVVIMTTFAFFFVPETKGIPIEEMKYIWGQHWFWKRFVPLDETGAMEMRAKGKTIDDEKPATETADV